MKVGKAIYNILSKSTDVQSNFPFNTTDYAPTGTELVTNGDFSAAGSNLVSNPNFTDTGADEVTYPNFTNSDLAQWTIANSRATKSWDASEFMRLTYDLAEGQALYAVLGAATVNASYKVTMRVRGTKSDGTTAQGSSFSRIGDNATIPATGIVSNPTLTSEWQDYEFYIVPTTTTFRFYLQSAAIGDLVDFDSISVKELGADWTVSGTDASHSVEFVESGARYQSGTTSPTLLLYQDALVVGKNYVLNVNITYTSGLLRLGSGIPSTDLVEGLNTLYFVASGVSASFLRGGTNVDCIISNISIQELGEGWTSPPVVDTSVTFGDSFVEITKNVATTIYLQQDYAVTLGASHKLTYTVLENTFTGSGTEIALSAAGAYGGSTLDSSVDTHTVYLTVTDDTPLAALRFYSQGDGGSIKITNISAQEMILTKIFPELAPPDIDAPYIVYSVVSNSPSETKNANGDIDTANIEVYGFQDTYNKAVDLGVSVRAALDRKTGTYNTIEIQSTNYVNEQMDVNEARKLWAAIQDYSIRIKNI